MQKKRILILLPLVLFAGLMVMAIIPLLTLSAPQDVVSPQPVPQFTRVEFSSSDLHGQVSLVNFFAS